MKILISACLLGQKCKYNGGDNFNERVASLAAEHEMIPVCPEVAGGLSVPRQPCEIVNGEVINTAGESRDSQFRDGAEKCLALARLAALRLALANAGCGWNFRICLGCLLGWLCRRRLCFRATKYHGVLCAVLSARLSLAFALRTRLRRGLATTVGSRCHNRTAVRTTRLNRRHFPASFAFGLCRAAVLPTVLATGRSLTPALRSFLGRRRALRRERHCGHKADRRHHQYLLHFVVPFLFG